MPLSITDRISSVYLVVFLVGMLLIINKKRDWQRFFGRLREPEVLIAIIFTLFYLLLVALTTINADHPDIFDDRYLSPMFIVVIMLIFIVVQELIISHLRMRETAIRLFIVLVFSVWLIYPISTMRNFALESIRDGVTTYNAINTRRYNESGTLAFLKGFSFQQDVKISSNYPEAAYFFTRLDVIDAPFDDGGEEPWESRLCLAMAEFRGKPSSYLIWFWPVSYKRYYPPKGLKGMFQVTTIYESTEGGIYLVNFDSVNGGGAENCE
ncbi:MAG: hypothetical protein N2C13_04235 [Chloroflexota bacterium]